jgi:hypothetical protein
MIPLRSALLAGLCLASPVLAQESAKGPPRIEDNSFLIEEAYNQDAGVVQHIGTFRRTPDAAWLSTFTQEWPAPSQRHQLSYTVPVLSARGDGTGLGDLALNYRYQALGRDEETVWFAPRLTLLVPTGSTRYGRGVGGPGVQVNLPLSVSVSRLLVTHWNVGSTVSRSRSFGGARGTPASFNAGASAILLVSPNLNVMLEGLYERNEALAELGGLVVEKRTTIVPGLRGAINFASGMQLVPGIGVPISGSNREDRDLFLYFSVEHSFK